MAGGVRPGRSPGASITVTAREIVAITAIAVPAGARSVLYYWTAAGEALLEAQRSR